MFYYTEAVILNHLRMNLYILVFFHLNGTDISSITLSSVKFNISVVDVIWWKCSLVAAVTQFVYRNICQTGLENSRVSVQVRL